MRPKTRRPAWRRAAWLVGLAAVVAPLGLAGCGDTFTQVYQRGYIPPEGLEREKHENPAAEFRVGGEATDPGAGTDEQPKDPGAEKPNE